MQRDCGRRLSNTNAGSTSGSHRYSSLSLLIVDIMIAAILFVRLAAAQEHLKMMTSGPHLKDWRFKICGEYGCVDKVVVCAPGYHIVYGNKCVVNVHTPPSWEDQVQPVVPPCEGCDVAHPTLYELYARSAWCRYAATEFTRWTSQQLRRWSWRYQAMNRCFPD